MNNLQHHLRKPRSAEERLAIEKESKAKSHARKGEFVEAYDMMTEIVNAPTSDLLLAGALLGRLKISISHFQASKSKSILDVVEKDLSILQELLDDGPIELGFVPYYDVIYVEGNVSFIKENWDGAIEDFSTVVEAISPHLRKNIDDPVYAPPEAAALFFAALSMRAECYLRAGNMACFNDASIIIENRHCQSWSTPLVSEPQVARAYVVRALARFLGSSNDVAEAIKDINEAFTFEITKEDVVTALHVRVHCSYLANDQVEVATLVKRNLAKFEPGGDSWARLHLMLAVVSPVLEWKAILDRVCEKPTHVKHDQMSDVHSMLAIYYAHLGNDVQELEHIDKSLLFAKSTQTRRRSIMRKISATFADDGDVTELEVFVGEEQSRREIVNQQWCCPMADSIITEIRQAMSVGDLDRAGPLIAQILRENSQYDPDDFVVSVVWLFQSRWSLLTGDHFGAKNALDESIRIVGKIEAKDEMEKEVISGIKQEAELLRRHILIGGALV